MKFIEKYFINTYKYKLKDDFFIRGHIFTLLLVDPRSTLQLDYEAWQQQVYEEYLQRMNMESTIPTKTKTSNKISKN